MVDLYVYYKVREQDAAVLEPRVRALQSSVCARWNIQAQLKRRPETRDGLQTWMEVYPAVPDAFQAALEDAVREAGMDALLAGPRRAEVFMDLTPCA